MQLEPAPDPAPDQTSYPCESCRSHEKTCSRTLPRCTQCDTASASCSFEGPQPHNAVSRSVEYVNGLEQKLDNLESDMQQQLDELTRKVHALQALSKEQSQIISSAASNAQPAADPDLQPETSWQQDKGTISAEPVIHRLSEQISLDEPSGVVEPPPEAEEHSIDGTIAPPEPNEPLSTTRAVISSSKARLLAQQYFDYNHTLYPVVRRDWFDSYLELQFTSPDSPEIENPFWLFSMWMVFAIGAKTHSAVTSDAKLADDAEDFYENAQVYFPRVRPRHHVNNLLMLDSILLEVSYGILKRIDCHVWYHLRIAIDLAIGLGMYGNPTQRILLMPDEEQQYCKRLLWSLYAMDRVVSISLGRPLGIRDCDIEIDRFSVVDNDREALAVQLHIISLRQIAGEIWDRVYTTRYTHLPERERNKIVSQLGIALTYWRSRSRTSASSTVPHMSAAWHDLNLTTHQILLHRPSPLTPILTPKRVRYLGDRCAFAISLMDAMIGRQLYPLTSINLQTLFHTSFTLIYVIMTQPNPILGNPRRNIKALDRLETAGDLLDIFAEKFRSAIRARDMVQELARRFRLSEAHSDEMGPGTTVFTPFPLYRGASTGLHVPFRLEPTMAPWRDAMMQMMRAGHGLRVEGHTRKTWQPGKELFDTLYEDIHYRHKANSRRIGTEDLRDAGE